MCTVSYIPLSDGFVLSSNRDEKISRITLIPSHYKAPDQILLYPKDQQAGGTWLATSSRGKLVCLLNGGIEKHQVKFNYSISRGKIVLDWVSRIDSPFFSNEYLLNVEPFTLISIEFRKSALDYHLKEFIWDGQQVHESEKDTSKNYLWSSVTLYSEDTRKERVNAFADFIQENNELSVEQVNLFHQNHILQQNEIQTTSISNCIYSQSAGPHITFLYHDYLADIRTSSQLDFSMSSSER